MASGDGRVVEDTERRFEDGDILRVRVLSVAESEKFPDGVKYRLHYCTDDDETIIHYDNSHGHHERHTPGGFDEDYEFPGYDAVQRQFWHEVEQVREKRSGSGEHTL